MNSLPTSKMILWVVLAVPAAVTVHRYATVPGIWPGDLLLPTGEWSARLIIFALMLTPLGQLFPTSRAVNWLIRHRRAFGVAAFGYAVLHLIFYVLDMESVAAMLAEIGAPGIWTGWLALLCLVPLALTSNDAAMRLLRRSWKRAQRLAYPAAILTLLHWVLVHDGMATALLHFAPLILLQALRLARLFTSASTERKTI
ncbi:MAG: ferric reductase-like transmembrane domain-containing protein [Sphingomonas bacterium]|nr:ferric reductase-like transmembrane domain-containing protein [Sphingomonas bacterium]